MNLIYDRTAEDVERALALAKKAEAGTLTDAEKAEWLAGMKGCYNATDMNRVEAAVKQLAAELNAAGYPAAVEPVLKGDSRLPSGYTELEYIQSSGTQYVDTGMKTTNETSIIIDAQVLAMNQEQYGGGLLFGSCNPVQDSGHEAYVWQYKFNAVYNSTANVDTQTLTVGDRLRVEFMKNVCTVIKNGQVFYTHTFSPSSFTSTVNLYLFLLPRSTQYFGKIKLYSCEIFEGSSLVRDFIPCKNPDGVVGLYDLVGGEFYTTPTAAEAVALPEGYTQVEYLQSSGTQYINTNFKPNGQSRIVMDCTPTSISSTFCFYCARSASSATVSDTNTLFFVPNAYRGDYYGQSASTSSYYSANTRVVIDNNKGNIKIGNYTIANSSVSTSSPMPWILMASAKSSGSAVDTSSLGNYASMKLYSCKIYNNGTLVRDFVPAKNSSGTIGLYDIVNNQFYTNAGTGTFTAGADIAGFTAGADVGSYEDREWQEGDVLYRPQWTTYLDNVQKLRDAYYTLTETGQLPDAEDKLDYIGANNIEKILADIDLLIGWMKSSYRRCGTFQSGNNAAHLPLKGSV